MKLWAVWFALRHRAAFGRLGRWAFMFRLCRIEGARGLELGDRSSVQRGSWLYCVSHDEHQARLHIGSGCDYCVALSIPARVIRRFDPSLGDWVSV